MIENIVRTLMLLNVEWDLDHVAAEVAKFGLHPAQSVGTRRTFEDAAGQKYSFYFGNDGHIKFVESTLDLILDTELLSNLDYQTLRNEFCGKYEITQQKVVAIAGECKDYSLNDDGEFPHGRDSIQLSLWKVGRADLMLELKHESPDVPMRLLLSLAPTASYEKVHVF